MALLLSKLGCVAAILRGFNTAEKMLDLYHAVTSENIAIEEDTRVLPPVSKCKRVFLKWSGKMGERPNSPNPTRPI
jgi:hypothetical protein